MVLELNHGLAGNLGTDLTVGDLGTDLTSGPGCGTPQLWPPGVSLAACAAVRDGQNCATRAHQQLPAGPGIWESRCRGPWVLEQKVPDASLGGEVVPWHLLFQRKIGRWRVSASTLEPAGLFFWC